MHYPHDHFQRSPVASKAQSYMNVNEVLVGPCVNRIAGL